MENHIENITSTTDTWIPMCRSDELEETSIQAVEVDGLTICVYRVNGIVYATDDRCSHGNAQLSDGDLEGYEIECPYHQGRFDIRTGQPTLPPCTIPIVVYPVQERDNIIWLVKQ